MLVFAPQLVCSMMWPTSCGRNTKAQFAKVQSGSKMVVLSAVSMSVSATAATTAVALASLEYASGLRKCRITAASKSDKAYRVRSHGFEHCKVPRKYALESYILAGCSSSAGCRQMRKLHIVSLKQHVYMLLRLSLSRRCQL
jgi:hypothetical protein